MSHSDKLLLSSFNNISSHHHQKERRKESRSFATKTLRHRRTSSNITSSFKQTANTSKTLDPTNTNSSNLSAMSKRQAQSAKINRMCNGHQLATMLGLVALVSGALLLASSLGTRADQDYSQSQLHQQQTAAHGQQQIQVTGGNGYEQQQQQQHQGPTKAKKIQIVYIKVPLAKLKPSLGHNESGNSYEGQQKSNDATDTKAQGSQSAADQQQRQISLDELNQFDSKQQQLSRPQSLLIPMAVVQTASDNELPGDQQLPFVGQQRLQMGSSNNQVSFAQAAPPNQRGTFRQVGPLSHGINHGFMSSFLNGEKEKMTLAAMRLQQQQPSAAASTASPQATTANLPQVSNPNKPQGGLMPFMMMPFSHMPDNAIGQAYNAAVGQALPMESGSPASLMGSPSMQLDSAKRGTQTGGNTNTNNNNGYNGGNSGTNGAASSSHGTGSSGSYGANGHGQQDAGSSGNGYQPSAGAFANTGPSSGYGNGINTFGASVAFSDYPAGQSMGSGPATYGAQSQLQTSSSNSNSNNHHHNQLQQGEHQDYNSQQKLRQAKKTIIPIVVQVEHAILENNQQPQGYQAPGNNRQPAGGNKYGGQRSNRQLGNHKRNRGNKGHQQNNNGALYGAATNEIGLDIGAPTGAQFINAANAQDINQITAAINAENAASAAAALAQADMALGAGSPAYIPGQQQRPQASHQQGGRQYAALQSAASALLANTHPVIQAAASGGLASVSKLGAKLGEIIALPSMQVPQSISSIGASLPTAFSSITNQMGAQLNQAVRQVAKEHPTAHAFARQVAQHAGIALPNFQQQAGGNQIPLEQQQHQHQSGSQNQMSMAASQQQQVQLSPQAQLQNLKLSIGQNLQTAAAQLMGVHQKANAQSAASLLASPLAALYPQSMNAALKQLSAMQFGPGSQQLQQQAGPMDPHHAQSSSIVPVQQQMSPAQSAQYQQQLLSQQSSQQQQQASDIHSPTSQSALLGAADQSGSSSSSAKPSKGSSLKSKFLSFFQPPKFISNLLSWNDRADERSDSAPEGASKTAAEQTTDKSKPEASLESRSANSTKEAVKVEQTASSKLLEVKSSNSSAPVVAEQQPKQPELSGSNKSENATQPTGKQN